jgi:hypothetical protein
MTAMCRVVAPSAEQPAERWCPGKWCKSGRIFALFGGLGRMFHH